MLRWHQDPATGKEDVGFGHRSDAVNRVYSVWLRRLLDRLCKLHIDLKPPFVSHFNACFDLLVVFLEHNNMALMYHISYYRNLDFFSFFSPFFFPAPCWSLGQYSNLDFRS